MSEVLSDPITDRGVHSGVLRRSQTVSTGDLLMAAGTALLACLALLVCAFLDLLPWEVAIQGTAGVITLVVLFYLIVRTKLNPVRERRHRGSSSTRRSGALPG